MSVQNFITILTVVVEILQSPTIYKKMEDMTVLQNIWITPWWLAAVLVINLYSMLVYGTWTTLKNQNMSNNLLQTF